MIAENRKTYQDLANRRHFTAEGKSITETRGAIAELTAPQVPAVIDVEARATASASNLRGAADDGFIEVG
jgi:hypothetical protein